MRIAVIGAGIVGTATAFELAQDGHQVTVLERRSSVAAESSFAPGGLLGAGSVLPWAAPGSPRHWTRGLFARDADAQPLPALDPGHWRRLWRHWRAGHAPGSAQQRELLKLAQYSQQRLRLLCEQTPFEFERSEGLLVLLGSERELAQAESTLALLAELGCPARTLDPAGCLLVEPALARDPAPAAAIHLPQTDVGNCRQLTQLLRDAAERAGVDFHFGAVVHAIEADGEGSLLRVEQTALSTGFAASRLATPGDTDPRRGLTRRTRAAARYLDPVSQERYDAVVVAAGNESLAWLPALGLRVPLLPVHGYSLTAPLRSADRGPLSAMLDATRRVVITRLGQRVRVTGGSELGAASARQRAATVETLYRALNGWFPGCAHLARPQVWRGARPMLADAMPLVGPSPRRGVWLNLGHGASGFALACGSARVLADQIAGRTPALDAAALDARRYAVA